MSTTITLEEAQVSLSELIHRMAPGEEGVITENQQPVARLVSELKSKREPLPPPGFMKGQVLYMASDFNQPLDDLKEYTE